MPELYAHALAMESEAAARYREFAARMTEQANDGLAAIFTFLADQEARHLATLKRRTDGARLPEIDRARYHWLGSGAPETPAQEVLLRLMTPRQALAVALHAERRAQRFFENVQWTASDPALRLLARELADDERGHAELIAAMLEASPRAHEVTCER